MSEGPDVDLEAYVNDIRNTVEAAVQAGHPEHEVRSELDSLLAGLAEGYDHGIEDRETLAEELDALVRNAYMPGDEVIVVLDDKVAELERIGQDAPEFDEMVQGEVDAVGATHGDVSVVDTEKADIDPEDLEGADAETLAELGVDIDPEEIADAQREELSELGVDPEELTDSEE